MKKLEWKYALPRPDRWVSFSPEGDKYVIGNSVHGQGYYLYIVQKGFPFAIYFDADGLEQNIFRQIYLYSSLEEAQQIAEDHYNLSCFL